MKAIIRKYKTYNIKKNDKLAGKSNYSSVSLRLSVHLAVQTPK